MSCGGYALSANGRGANFRGANLCGANLCGANFCGEGAEVADEPVDVRFVVLYGDQPLLDLAPGRQEHPAVVLEQPVSVTERAVDGEELAVVPDDFRAEDDAALGAGGHHPTVQAELLDYRG